MTTEYLFPKSMELSVSDFIDVNSISVSKEKGVSDCGLVYFYAHWCKYCRESKNIIFKLARKHPHAMVKVFSCKSREHENADIDMITSHVNIFPTIHFFREVSGVMKLITTFEGERTVNDLSDFLMENDCGAE